MESLNLNTLVSSLPTAHQNAEKDLLNNFKAAALSITTLYRSSRHTSKRAYNAGYAAACQDLLMMIQQGVSVGGISPSGPSHDAGDGGMTIGRVMDWIEARLEAIKSREEEEDEDEEKEKERERGRPPPTAGAKPDNKATKPSVPSTSASSSSRPKDQQAASTLPTPNSPRAHPSSTQLPSQPSSPSPPPSTTLRPIHPQPPQRPSKSRAKDPADRPNPSPIADTTGFNFISDSISSPASITSFPTTPIPIAAGAKRRHAVMMMLDSASSPVSIGSSSPGGTSHPLPSAVGNGYGAATNHGHGVVGAGGSRRRTRSSRSVSHQQNQNLNLIQASEAMDVEEDGGRERKRVSRR